MKGLGGKRKGTAWTPLPGWQLASMPCSVGRCRDVRVRVLGPRAALRGHCLAEPCQAGLGGEWITNKREPLQTPDWPKLESFTRAVRTL